MQDRIAGLMSAESACDIVSCMWCVQMFLFNDVQMVAVVLQLPWSIVTPVKKKFGLVGITKLVHKVSNGKEAELTRT